MIQHRIPVGAYEGGRGYHYVAGPPAQFPWNDFSKPDEAGFIVFDMLPGGAFGGNAMGRRLIALLDQFTNDGARADGRASKASFADRSNSLGKEFEFRSEGAVLFSLFPRNAWKDDALAAFVAERILE